MTKDKNCPDNSWEQVIKMRDGFQALEHQLYTIVVVHQKQPAKTNPVLPLFSVMHNTQEKNYCCCLYAVAHTLLVHSA